jgi:hypothetical protein
MARIVLSLPIRRTSDNVLTANTSPALEVFRTATYATSTLSSSTALAVAECGGIVTGCTVRVGTNAAVAASAVSATTGAGTITLATAQSWANNDAVVMTKTAAAVDAYATVYYDQTYATAVLTQPIVANNDNEVRVYIKPGRYGVRWSNSAGTTLDLDHDVAFDETDWVQVTPQHDSKTAGIAEAIAKLSSKGGTVYVPAGTFTVTAAIVVPSNVRFIGAGIGATIITVPTGLTQFNSGIVDVGANSNVEIAYLTIDGNIANNASLTNPSNIFGAGASNIWIHNTEQKNAIKDGIVFFSGAGQTNSNVLIDHNYVHNIGLDGIQVFRGLRFIIADNIVVSTGSHGIYIGNGTQAATDVSNQCTISGNIVDRSVAPTTLAVGLGGVQQGFLIGYDLSNNDLLIANNVASSAGSDTDDGIGWGRPASSPVGLRIEILGNNVYKSGGFGIDVPMDGIVANNYVANPYSHGIALGADPLTPATDYVYKTVIIENNMVVDVNEGNQASASIGGIYIGIGSNSNRTIDNLIIRNNVVTDSRARMGRALHVIATASQTIGNLIITGNDFSHAVTAAIYWNNGVGSPITTGITSIGFRDNRTKDVYYGEVTLVAGVSGTQARNTVWPALAGLRFNISRTDVVSTGHAIGLLEGKWDGTNTLTITARKPADALVEPADVSKVFWEFLGTVS